MHVVCPSCQTPFEVPDRVVTGPGLPLCDACSNAVLAPRPPVSVPRAGKALPPRPKPPAQTVAPAPTLPEPAKPPAQPDSRRTRPKAPSIDFAPRRAGGRSPAARAETRTEAVPDVERPGAGVAGRDRAALERRPGAPRRWLRAHRQAGERVPAGPRRRGGARRLHQRRRARLAPRPRRGARACAGAAGVVGRLRARRRRAARGAGEAGEGGDEPDRGAPRRQGAEAPLLPGRSRPGARRGALRSRGAARARLRARGSPPPRRASRRRPRSPAELGHLRPPRRALRRRAQASARPAGPVGPRRRGRPRPSHPRRRAPALRPEVPNAGRGRRRRRVPPRARGDGAARADRPRRPGRIRSSTRGASRGALPPRGSRAACPARRARTRTPAPGLPRSPRTHPPRGKDREHPGPSWQSAGLRRRAGAASRAGPWSYP